MLPMKKKCNLLSDECTVIYGRCAVDSGFEPISGPTKDYKIDICCFSAKHTSLKRKNKDWLAEKRIKQKTKQKLVENVLLDIQKLSHKQSQYFTLL
jgi:hypothetical protein